MQPIKEILVPEPVRPMKKLETWGTGLRFASIASDGKVAAIFPYKEEAAEWVKSHLDHSGGAHVIDITTGEKV